MQIKTQIPIPGFLKIKYRYFSGLWYSMCVLKLPAREEAKSHWLHLFDLSPLCDFICLPKWPALEDAKSHWLHLFHFSPLMIMFIVMTNFGQLVYMQKPKQLSELITNGSNKEKTKRIEQFPKNPGIEYKANTVPKNTGIPGFCKNTVPYRTGMKFLIPLGPACDAQKIKKV